MIRSDPDGVPQALTTGLSRRWRHLRRDVPCVDIDQRELGDRWCKPKIGAAPFYLYYRGNAANAVAPDCLLQDVLSRLGSWQTMQTSALSRRWRHLWRDVPCLDIDQRGFGSDWGLFDHVLSPEFEYQWQRFEDFADHLSSPSAPQVDAFRLYLVSSSSYVVTDRWIRRGLRRSPAAVHINTEYSSAARWRPHLWSSCTRRLTTLRLVGVVMAPGFVEHLGEHCPVLEDLYMEKCRADRLAAVASPTLRSLAIIEPRVAYGSGGADPVLTAPRLASLRLDLTYNGLYGAEAPAPEKEALPSLAQAWIRITETGNEFQRNQRVRKKRKLEFSRAMRSLLACLPNVTDLRLSGFTTTALLDEETKKFPVLRRLRSLLLEECDVGVSLLALRSILHNTSDLHNLGLHRCKLLGAPTPIKKRTKKRRCAKCGRATPPIQYKNLKLVEIMGRQDDAPHQHADVLSEISKGMPEEMPLEEWVQVKIRSQMGPTTQWWRPEE